MAGEEIRFLAFGDWGMGNSGQREVARAMSDHCAQMRCDFILGLGDNFYPVGVKSVSDPLWETRYEKMYGGMNLPFYSALGNHDYAGSVQAQIDYTGQSATWKMPARYFTFKRGPAEFFVIDTNDFNSKQADWLKGALAKSTAAWKIVYGHHPIYSYGRHGNNPALGKKLLPLFANRVNFYVAGHDHDLQLLRPDGKTHFVISGAAAQNRGVSMGNKAVFTSSELGFTYFTVSDEAAKYQAYNDKGELLFEKVYPASARLNRR